MLLLETFWPKGEENIKYDRKALNSHNKALTKTIKYIEECRK